MGNRLRLWEPNIVYSAVERTVDRQFLFKPNHLPDNPLLRHDSDPRSLSPTNLLLPRPSTINVIGSSLVRAQQNNPVDLMWAEGNINHIHPGFSAPNNDSLDLISKFKRDANSLIARFVNKAHLREGHVFSGPFRAEPCLSDGSAEQKLLYAVTNVVKDNLVEKVSQSPFFSTYRHFAFGETLEFWWIEWRKYELAGGARNNKIHPKDFMKWGELKFTCLPKWRDMTLHQRQTRFRKAVQEIEQEHKEKRRDENRTVVGVPALYALDPRDRPKNPKPNSRQPLCHADNLYDRNDFEKRWCEFVNEHKKASADFLAGYWEREFPDGSFRPPITTIYNSSHL